MKKTYLTLPSLLLVIGLFCGALSACKGGTHHSGQTDGEAEPSETELDSENDSSEEETDSGEASVTVREPKTLTEKLVFNANRLANGVQAFFTDANRTHYSIQNTEMTMTYARSDGDDQLVESIKNTQGASYVSNTMDVFVRTKNGSNITTFYASNSTVSAEVNLYRFGYYYYEGLFEFQNFAADGCDLIDPTEIDLEAQLSSVNQIVAQGGEDAVYYTIQAPGESDTRFDPKFTFEKDIKYSTNQNDVIAIVAKSFGDTTRFQIMLNLGDGFKAVQATSVKTVNDGEFHVYQVPLASIPGYSTASALTGIRIDPNGEENSGIAIQRIILGKAPSEPSALSINRHFHVYSDKMHHAIQFATTERIDNIVEVGMLTEIDKSTVAKIMIVTDDGKTYTSLDAVSSWDSIVAVGFDIKSAGIFGFILPKDEIAGKITVTENNGIYVIEQTRTPTLQDGTAGVIIPSIDTEKKDANGFYVHAQGVVNNGNDFYLGQRIYTDESHDFDEFVKETKLERNPLTDDHISVSAENSDSAEFLGYDAKRGIYVFSVDTPSGGFYTPYNDPQKNYKVNFTVRSDTDREIYLMTAGESGLLECATLMDENMMLLPVPLEVSKNYSEAKGERNLFNISDPEFDEVMFWLPLTAGVEHSYTVINLYQNWGNYPLKQLSQIPFHCPYYHLSTGVTETNCILPWQTTAEVEKSNITTLPDFRSMSAPFYSNLPQHNSCGKHTWLSYTDAEGGKYLTENYENEIVSYGPTYAEVKMSHLSDDGKIKVTYTHMEMPQTDENRTYYTVEYEFLEDLTIKRFKDNFEFYSVTDNDSKGSYKKLGYLDENNVSRVVDSNQDKVRTLEYVLGDNCPYFSFFMMPDWNRESTSAEGYANVAFLIYNSDFTIGGEKKDYNFLIKNSKDYVTLTLNEAGSINFKAGDRIVINAILMPWGSQQYEDGIFDLNATPKNYEYDMTLEDGTLYMDKNVRDVRENTLLNPLTVTSETDEILDSPFLPKIKSRDGKTATFTLSGGENNVAVRIFGFEKLTSPKVERLDENGEWVEYVLSSKNNPVKGLHHYYDGYMVNYDGDGTYSYSFVVTMEEGESQTFRISADEDFAGWPEEPERDDTADRLNIFTDNLEIHSFVTQNSKTFGKAELIENDEKFPYTRVYVNTSALEGYYTFFSEDNEMSAKGQYLVIKYRIPTDNPEAIGNLQIFASTKTKVATQSGNFYHAPIADGKWHVDVIDLSKASSAITYVDQNGKYYTKLLRIDIFNKVFSNSGTYIDLAYVGIDSDLSKICWLENGISKTVNLYENGVKSEIDVTTGQVAKKTYLDPASGYTASTLRYGANLDTINDVSVSIPHSASKGIYTISGLTASETGILNVAGWCCVDGGIEKYVYSTDGGKTWADCGGDVAVATDAILNAAQTRAGITFPDGEASRKNARFQLGVGSGLVIDISDVEAPVDVVLAAVPTKDPSTLVLLYFFEEVEVSE
ncbi:MAG: hypothetical protein IJY39_06600 [Clostridia bacterium]|nr:hypothetical protein [Clostridia bacterium]